MNRESSGESTSAFAIAPPAAQHICEVSLDQDQDQDREAWEDEFSIYLGYSKDMALINDWFHHAPPSAQPASIFI